MEFDFSQEKNEILFQQRNITFYQIIEAIAENGILLNIKHPNENDYPNQWMMVVEYNNYTYCIPYVIDGETWFLKTIFPNRKYMYLINKKRRLAMNEKYLDEEEKELLEAFGNVADSQENLPSNELQKQIKAAAKEFVKKETKMNIRIDSYELDKIKAVAEQEGLKYQTFVKSVLHKYITGQLVDKRAIS